MSVPSHWGISPYSFASSQAGQTITGFPVKLSFSRLPVSDMALKLTVLSQSETITVYTAPSSEVSAKCLYTAMQA